MANNSNSSHDATVFECVKAMGYVFNRPELLAQALVHRSYAMEQGKSVPDNELLEFLGDSVLNLSISHLLFHRYGTSHNEGDLTRMRAALVNEQQLSEMARRVGLDRYILLGRGEARSHGCDKPSILGDAFEAVLGAVYLDGGYEAALSVIGRCFHDLIVCADQLMCDQDYKTMLQEETQRIFKITPVYKLDAATGPDHEKTFCVNLYLNDELLARGVGKSKKEAEQNAAKEALKAGFSSFCKASDDRI
jgi:ribonuclease-3